MSKETHEMIVGYIRGAINEAISRIEYAKNRTTIKKDDVDTELINEFLKRLAELKNDPKISEN